ncbi:MAG: arginase family protein [Candidatus Sulfobium sp.]
MIHAPVNFLGLPDEWSGLERSRVVILPLPYEHTTSYGKGTVRGPEEILKASRYLELYDEELDSEAYRSTNGIATCPSINFGPDCVDSEAVEAIRAGVSALIGQGKFVVCIGGEHTVAVGAAQAHTQFFDDLTVLQLDAHSDLRQEYEENPYSHATVMARIYDFNRNIVQVGIRSQSAEEATFIKDNSINTIYDAGIRLGRYDRGKKRFSPQDCRKPADSRFRCKRTGPCSNIISPAIHRLKVDLQTHRLCLFAPVRRPELSWLIVRMPGLCFTS